MSHKEEKRREGEEEEEREGRRDKGLGWNEGRDRNINT